MSASTAQAAPLPGQGTWELTLKARDIDGYAVALDDHRAAFFYDATLDVTWLADWNASAGTPYDDAGLFDETTNDGLLSVENARQWAAKLPYFGGDWRLPAITGPLDLRLSFIGGTDHGYNVRINSSELAHMWYVTLGNRVYTDPLGLTYPIGWGHSNSAYFRNIMPRSYRVEVIPDQEVLFEFSMSDGGQGFTPRGVTLPVVALRDGDVLVVPEPEHYLLYLVGTTMVLLAARRRGSSRQI
ncbi:MAG: hypothetical protein B7Z52_00295, partial [Burkholderiales bacterium 12-64-5]